MKRLTDFLLGTEKAEPRDYLLALVVTLALFLALLVRAVT